MNSANHPVSAIVRHGTCSTERRAPGQSRARERVATGARGQCDDRRVETGERYPSGTDPEGRTRGAVPLSLATAHELAARPLADGPPRDERPGRPRPRGVWAAVGGGG